MPLFIGKSKSGLFIRNIRSHCCETRKGNERFLSRRNKKEEREERERGKRKKGFLGRFAGK